MSHKQFKTSLNGPHVLPMLKSTTVPMSFITTKATKSSTSMHPREWHAPAAVLPRRESFTKALPRRLARAQTAMLRSSSSGITNVSRKQKTANTWQVESPVNNLLAMLKIVIFRIRSSWGLMSLPRKPSLSTWRYGSLAPTIVHVSEAKMSASETAAHHLGCWSTFASPSPLPFFKALPSWRRACSSSLPRLSTFAFSIPLP